MDPARPLVAVAVKRAIYPVLPLRLAPVAKRDEPESPSDAAGDVPKETEPEPAETLLPENTETAPPSAS
jgi:hypothetical protein